MNFPGDECDESKQANFQVTAQAMTAQGVARK
jgi:hypothetical protein